jgi:hypothetical protein
MIREGRAAQINGDTFRDWSPKLRHCGSTAGDNYSTDWALVAAAVGGSLLRWIRAPSHRYRHLEFEVSRLGLRENVHAASLVRWMEIYPKGLGVPVKREVVGLGGWGDYRELVGRHAICRY